jgi:hypothetical protein
VAAWLFALANRYWVSWVTAVIDVIDVTLAAIGLGHAKAVDPFYVKCVSPSFGYVVLILGAIALIISVRLSSSEPKAETTDI